MQICGIDKVSNRVQWCIENKPCESSQQAKKSLEILELEIVMLFVSSAVKIQHLESNLSA